MLTLIALLAAANPSPPPPPTIVVAPVKEADVAAGTGRTASSFAKELEAVRPALSACANEAGKEQSIALTLLLHDDGSIAKIDAPADQPKLASCVRGTLSSTRFSVSSAKEQTLKVTLHAAKGEPVAVGRLGKDVVASTVKEHLADVKACYDAAPKAVGEGAVTMRFVVDSDGTVFDAQGIEASKGFAPVVVDCLRTKTMKWKWPKPKGGGRVVVTYPFEFKKTAPVPFNPTAP